VVALKMNVIIVSTAYYPSIGGVQTQARLAAHWLARRHRVEVAALFLGTKAIGGGLKLPSYQSYLDGEVPVHALTATPRERLRVFLLQYLYGLAATIPITQNRRRDQSGAESYIYQLFRSVYLSKLRLLMRGKDVVHCVDKGYLGWAAEEAARAEGVPFVLTPYIHVGFDGEDESNIELYRRADVVFGLLETDVQKLIGLGVSPTCARLSGVVPILPQTSDPSAFRRRHGLGNRHVVLFVGRMVKHKGFTALLSAAPRVLRVMPDVIFVFIGPSASEAGEHSSNVRILGLISEQEKADAFAACDLFCMPSVKEILPAVYLEAWSYGKPVVGGTAHGLRELIEGNGGGKVVAQDPKLIAHTIIELLRDEPGRRQMGERGRAIVESRYSESAVFGAFEAAYEDVVVRRSKGTR
jgi:phosphatidyl-myo-inositol dimannoside synthase